MGDEDEPFEGDPNAEAELPIDGVADWLDRFWVAEHQGHVVGVAGMERYGDSGLLRSVGVAREWRGTGVGRTLVERVLDEGRAAGVRDVYLLTTTAEHYFPRLGFAPLFRKLFLREAGSLARQLRE